MARNKGRSAAVPQMEDYRYAGARRKNNPPAKMAAEGTVPAIPKAAYQYNPHLPPVLRFDATGGADKLPPLIEKATREKLSAEEAALLADALRKDEPWLEWAGKREVNQAGFEVDPIALHIHERVSAQAILKIAARQDIERSLFADPQQAYHEAVQFYRHDIDWANRLILGDSLSVMSSLAKREDLAGKVQMIYIDPPYGIKFASNFQPEIGRRDVKDNQQDLTREPEMVKAYRDTWELGVHSYLSYLRDRLIVARELLTDTGSIFIQISDENLHRVRELMGEIYGQTNFCGIIHFSKTTSASSELLSEVTDYLVWFARNRESLKYRDILQAVGGGARDDESFDYIELISGSLERRSVAGETPGRLVTLDDSSSQGAPKGGSHGFEHQGSVFHPAPGRHFSQKVPDGMHRLAQAELLAPKAERLFVKKYADRETVARLTAVWGDTRLGGFRRKQEKLYVVQTAEKVIERCILMTTDPGDLVLDPTCGSGTTAYVAEQWGRRWITIDTSRVALSIARQRLLTAKFDYYKLRPLNSQDAQRNPRGTWLSDAADAKKEPRTFDCKTVPHVTLKSIAQNVALDPIFAKHEPILEQRLAAANAALAKVDAATRQKLEAKLILKQRSEGKKAVTDADRRRWLLPPENRDRSDQAAKRATVDLDSRNWYAWEVPFDTDPDWPRPLQDAVTEYRAAWRAKMDEVNAAISASAEQEELVDQPHVVRGVVRVSGPFTVEAVQPPEMSLGDVLEPQRNEGMFEGEPNPLESFSVVRPVELGVGVTDLAPYLDKMVRLLRGDGVTFPNNQHVNFQRLEPTFQSGRSDWIHAEGAWTPSNSNVAQPGAAPGAALPQETNNVAITFGPQYGPVTASQVVESARTAFRRGYSDLVVAGFSFDAAAFDEATNYPNPRLKIHIATIRPDVNPAMEGLLKERPGSQLFTVFGQPRTSVRGPDAAGQYTLTMEGVDIYDPVENRVVPSGADKVAAWFLDSDYDGRTFCITQAFFPDKSAWEKLSRALNGKDGLIDAERFEALGGTVSLPFAAGKNRTAAVKVIDRRGNEVMSVHALG